MKRDTLRSNHDCMHSYIGYSCSDQNYGHYGYEVDQLVPD